MSRLTGRLRVRSGLFKTLVLQVEESYVFEDNSDPSYLLSPSHGKTFTRWRDARVEDVPVMRLSE